MNENVFSRLRVAGGVVLAILIASISLTISKTNQLQNDAQWVSHSHEVMASLQTLISKLTEAESCQRGFIITGNSGYLQSYSSSLAESVAQLDSLESLTADNPEQHRRIPDLRAHTLKRAEELQRVLSQQAARGIDAAKVRILTGGGKVEMDAVRSEVQSLLSVEDSLLADRSRQSAASYQSAVATELIGGIVSILAISTLVYLLLGEMNNQLLASSLIAEQEMQSRTTLASIGDAVIVTDEDGIVTNMNPVAEQLTGWKMRDALGTSMDVVFNIVNETTRAKVESPAVKALREGAIVGLANHTVLIAKSGQERPIDDSAAPIKNDSGETTGVVLVFRDVTERRAVDLALRESEERFRLLADAAPVLIWMADLDLSGTWFNQQWLDFVGCPMEEELGQKWMEGFHPDESVEARTKLEESFQSQIPFSLDLRIKRYDGEFRWIVIHGTPRKSADGTVLGYIGSAVDITSRVNAETALIEADKRKDEFLATLAHELRNPLAPMSYSMEILRQPGLSPEVVDKAKDTNERQLKHLVRLVDDLLDISRISRDKLQLQLTEVELASVIHQAVETARPIAEARNHTLDIYLTDDPVYLTGDATRLAQVFSNLLHNACKFTPPGGKVSLSVERKGSAVEVSVSDTGVGIPDAMLPAIFNMFTQVDPSIERTQGGLGIGLSLVKRLVELHGGSVSAFSSGQDSGSTFTVKLPFSNPNASVPELPATPVEAMHSKPRRILVVDDNQDAAHVLSLLLQRAGHKTKVAHDGQAALEAAEEFRPDVAILDIGLPKLNGNDVARRLRQTDWGKRIGLIAVTGWGQDLDRQKSKESGFDAHAVKPISYGDLSKLLAELAAKGEERD